MLSRVYQALKPGGVFLLSQKVQPEHEETRIWHEAFKEAQGYSKMAIAQKRESLEAVMQTDTIATEEERLREIGFVNIDHYFKALSFNAWAAYKA